MYSYPVSYSLHSLHFNVSLCGKNTTTFFDCYVAFVLQLHLHASTFTTTTYTFTFTCNYECNYEYSLSYTDGLAKPITKGGLNLVRILFGSNDPHSLV